MLEAKPTGWWSSTFVVLDDGVPVTKLKLKLWREGGGFELDGMRYTLRREGVAGDFLVEDEQGMVLARADKPSAFRNRFVLTHPGGILRLEPTSWTGRAYRVLGADTLQVGELRRRSMWRQVVEADLPADLPRPVRVFILLLVLLLIRRDDAAAST